MALTNTTPNTIVLKGCGTRKEAIASGAITPGHLVEFGGAQDLRVHATAGGNARKAFAVENDLMGTGIDTAYALLDQVQYNVFKAGDEVYALVAAGAAAITKGNALESAGDGTLQVEGTATATGDTDIVVAYALESVDNSVGGSAVRIKVEVA